MTIGIVNWKQGTESTLSKLWLNGHNTNHYWLQDQDRGLTSSMSLSEIAHAKVHGKTAIPTGKYRVKMTYSNRFGRMMPEVLNVPGFGGIRFHKGNYVGNTDGCPLPGETFDQDKLGYYRVWNSGVVFDPLLTAILKAEKAKEPIWCEVSRLYTVSIPVAKTSH